MTQTGDDQVPPQAPDQGGEETSPPPERPPGAEVDNTGELPQVVREWEQTHEGQDVEGKAGSADPSRRFREQEPSDEERKRVEEERRERLDPDNRPDNAEVDNTGRDFDDETGTFVDKDQSSQPESSQPESSQPESSQPVDRAEDH